jgi:hypothetical protein
MQSPLISGIGIVVSLIGLAVVGIYVWKISRQLIGDPLNSLLYFQAIGSLFALLIVIRSIFGDILNLIERDGKIETGTSVSGTRYDFFRIFDRRCSEIYLIGQNLRTLLDRPCTLTHLTKMLKANSNLHVKLLLSTPEIMTLIDPAAGTHHIQTVKQLKDFCSGLKDAQMLARVTIRFHPGTTALSALIRDPNSETRGIIIFTPKWATDLEPGNRIYCVVRKWKDPEIFKRIFGHVPIMVGRDAMTLEEVANKLGV